MKLIHARLCLRSCFRTIGASLLCTLLSSCDSAPKPSGFELPVTATPTTAPVETVLARDAWSFGSTRGIALTTRSYRIYTTSQGSLPTRLPIFLETALLHDRTAIVPLPAPAERMETFVLANRSEWTRCVQMIWAEKADPYLTIQRGGVTAGGKSVLYDIGPRDTLVLAAHEGWHQFAQVTFKEQLPTWLDEGIACYMEGFRTDTATNQYVFLPWANPERFDRLRDAKASGVLLSLREVIESSPSRQISASRGDALTWYAQAWALVHWLNEADGAARKPALEKIIQDGAAGRILSHVEEKLGPRAAVYVRQKRPGPEIFLSYFGNSIDEADRSYQDFISRVVSTGSRDKIIAGHSPVEVDTAPPPSPPKYPTSVP